jgi:hypothetical protein
VSCTAIKNGHQSSPDGVYWIAPGGVPQRAYCDMALPGELCTETAGPHQGRTRGKTELLYDMTSLLLLDQGVCKIWAVRGADEAHPIDGLEAVKGLAAGQTCIALGFAADDVVGSCLYGSDVGYSNCGFSATPLYWYGNACMGCKVGEGQYDHWVLQGPAVRASVLSNMTGSIFTTCKVSK